MTERKRGRPELTAQAHADMRARIEATAVDLFRREGYAAVSMRRLAAALGCSPMTLYGYFENKIDLLRALWAEVFRDLFDQLGAQLPAGTDAAARLRLLSLGYVRYWLDHPDTYRMVFMTEGVSQPEVSVFVSDPDTAARIALFATTLAEAAVPPLGADQVQPRVDFLLSVLHGIAHCRITMAGYAWTTEDVLVERAIRSVLMA